MASIFVFLGLESESLFVHLIRSVFCLCIQKNTVLIYFSWDFGTQRKAYPLMVRIITLLKFNERHKSVGSIAFKRMLVKLKLKYDLVFATLEAAFALIFSTEPESLFA